MFKRKIDKLDALQEDLNSYYIMEELEKLIRIMEHYDEEKAYFSDIVSAINEIPKKKLTQIQKDKVGAYEKYKEVLYKAVIYSVYFDQFEVLDNKELLKIVNDEISKRISVLYGKNVPAELNRAITNVECTKGKYKYLDYNLMVQLYRYQYAKILEDNEQEIKEKLKEKEEKISAIKIAKQKIKRAVAKMALYGMLIIPTYVGPAVVSIAGAKAIARTKSYETRVVINGEELKESKTTEPLFKEAISEEYKKRDFQYITDFGDTKDKKVVVKVYDYTGAEVSEDELDSIDLDDAKLIYCNTLKTKGLSKGEVFGEYTGEAHRDITELKYEFDEDIYKAKTVGFSAMLLVGSYLVVFLIHMGFESNLFSATSDAHSEYEESTYAKRRAYRDLNDIEKKIADLVIREFARKRSQNISAYDEKYYSDAEVVFQKRIKL